MSSGITVSVTVKPYVFRWISSVYGIPAKFPKRSYLNFLLGQLIAKPPSGFVYRPTDDNLLIELPFFTGKDVRVYSWLSENSKKELVRSIRQQFYVSMFDEVEFNRYKLGMSTGSAIRLFMEKYDIDEIYFDTLKKKEYRKRDRKRAGKLTREKK